MSLEDERFSKRSKHILSVDVRTSWQVIYNPYIARDLKMLKISDISEQDAITMFYTLFFRERYIYIFICNTYIYIYTQLYLSIYLIDLFRRQWYHVLSTCRKSIPQHFIHFIGFEVSWDTPWAPAKSRASTTIYCDLAAEWLPLWQDMQTCPMVKMRGT